MKNNTPFGSKLRQILSPLVNAHVTLLLFATFIFHALYFGEGHPTSDLMAFSSLMQNAIIIYGAITLLVGLIRLPEDWQPLVTLLLYIGNVFISIAYTSFFWMDVQAAPSWQELLMEVYTLLEGVLSAVLVILLLLQKPEDAPIVRPRLARVSGWGVTLLILAYVVG